jgi:hypothetical protein
MTIFLIAVMMVSFFTLYFACPKHERWTIAAIGLGLLLLAAIAYKG